MLNLFSAGAWQVPCKHGGMKMVLPTSSHARSQCGFTLIEQLIAVVVMTIVFAALFLTLNFASNMTSLTQQNLRATQILTEKMELMRLYTWQQITNGTSIPLTFTNYYFPDSINNSVTYTGTVSIATPPFSNNYVSTLKLVTITLIWNSGTTLHSRQDSTLVSNNGLQAYVY